MSAVRRAIQKAGGLATQAELAKHWGLSKQRVSDLVSQPGFPEPVDTVGSRPVWAIGECDEWRAGRTRRAA